MPSKNAIVRYLESKKLTKLERTVSPDEKRRLARLVGILDRLKRKENVQNRALQTWLTAAEYNAIEDRWAEQRAIRADIKDKPSVLLRYEAMLKKAIFTHNRAEGLSSKGNSTTASNLYNMAEAQFETALEYLHENVTLDASLTLWLDRDVDISPNGNLSLSPVGMPRVITSRSLDKEIGGLETAKMTKIEVKEAVVERAIDAIMYV